MVKIGKYYYKLSGFADDDCYHDCARYLDPHGFQKADKLRYIIKQHTKIVKNSKSAYTFKYSYCLKGAY